LGVGAAGGERWRRLAWIPAAALVLLALAATVVGTAGPRMHSATSPGPKDVITKPGHQGATPQGNPATGNGNGTSGTGLGPRTPAGPGGSGPTSVQPIAFLGVPASGGSPSGSPGPGSSGGGSNPGPNPGSTPGPNPPPPASTGGGLFGLVGTLTGGIPIVGGSSGVVGTLTALLTGSPTTTAPATAG
jgi:hypothetical protein